MKKILYTAAILMCFTSKCIITENDINTLKGNLQKLINEDIKQLQNKYQDLKIERPKNGMDYLDKCLANFRILSHKMFTKEYNDYVQKFNIAGEENRIFYSCTLNQNKVYMTARDIHKTLFYLSIKNEDFNFAIKIASDMCLCANDKINPINVNFICNGIENAQNLLPTINEEFTIGKLLEKNDEIMNINDTLIKTNIDTINTNNKLANILIFNQNLKNLIEYNPEDINNLFFKDRYRFEIENPKEEFSTTVALKKVIYKLADKDLKHMQIIDELLEEYFTKNYHLNQPDKIINYCADSLELNKEKLENNEISFFLCSIANAIKEDSEIGEILLKYIHEKGKDLYISKAIECDKYKLAEKFAKKTFSTHNKKTISWWTIIKLRLDQSKYNIGKNEEKNIKELTLLQKKKDDQYKETMVQIALSAIEERSFIIANAFLNKLKQTISLRREFKYKNESCTFASHYGSSIYNKTRYFIEYEPNKWKLLNTNANEELEKLIGWNKKWQQQNNIKDFKLPKGGKEIIDMLWSIKPQNFDILYSFVEELLQHKYLDFNAILEYKGKLYKLSSILINRHMLKPYKCKDFNGISDFLNEHKSNNILAPNLTALDMSYTNINFIQMIKENDYKTIKNVMKYCLNDLRNYQTRSKLRFTVGSKLCLDIINKMLEIQSSCN